MNNKIREILHDKFPFIEDENLINDIANNSKVVSLKENDILIDYGEVIKYMPLLYKGSIKVFKENEKGKELFLYYIEEGQGCAISFSCFDKMSSIRAEAAEDAELIAAPMEKMEEWVAKYPAWNRFVLSVYNQRFEEVLESLNELAFNKLDERLLDYLDKQAIAQESKNLKITHAQIAQELNTSREVISRLLKKLEQQDKVQLKRNEILLVP